jgi:hypothetical protein
MERTGLSVIICSYNAQSRITPTLEALAKCEAKFPVEVILVDNNSSDQTVPTARAAWERLACSYQFRILNEPRPGKYFAQKTGVIEACHEFIVFCDDDNWLSVDYLSRAAEVLSCPTVGAVSGLAEPVFEVPPHPFVYSHGSWLALGIQALSSGDVTHSRGYVWGAGLGARRSNLLKIYQCPGLPILVGPTGELSAARGEDNELCWALTVLNTTLVYDDKLRLRHYMPESRIQLSYLRKRAEEAGPTWDQSIVRFTVGLRALDKQTCRLHLAVKSAIRCLRYFNWPEERHYQASMFFAALDWAGPMRGVERRLYIAFKWLQHARQAFIGHKP